MTREDYVKRITIRTEQYLTDCLDVCESAGLTTKQAAELLGDIFETLYLSVSNIEARMLSLRSARLN